MSKTLLVCNDAGAATLLAYWCIQERNDFVCAIYGPAQKIFSQKDFRFTDEPIKSLLTKRKYNKIVTGTGWMTDIEKTAIKYAVTNNIYCISAIDHWVNYKERFILNGKHYHPNEIWVGDQYALNIANKIFDKSIKVVRKNSPLQWKVDNLVKYKSSKNENSYLKQDKRILLVMEPIRKQWANRKTIYKPEIESLIWFRNNLEKIITLLKVENQISIFLRPHPSEESGKYAGFIEEWGECSNTKLRVSRTEDVFDDIYDSDIVLGCETQALVIALMMKKQVGSILPPWSPRCSLPHSGIIHLGRLI